jgi:hypothetical protein
MPRTGAGMWWVRRVPDRPTYPEAPASSSTTLRSARLRSCLVLHSRKRIASVLVVLSFARLFYSAVHTSAAFDPFPPAGVAPAPCLSGPYGGTWRPEGRSLCLVVPSFATNRRLPSPTGRETLVWRNDARVEFLSLKGHFRGHRITRMVSALLICRSSAAHIVALAGDEARVVRSKEVDDRRDLFRTAHASHRYFAAHILDGFGVGRRSRPQE